jgi:lysophospholipase L1-like esterase
MAERELSHGALMALLPVVAAQGLWVRRRTLRLPEADGRRGTFGPGTNPLSVAVVGDSVAAGTGIADHRLTIAGQLARRLHLRYGRPVAWSVVAQGGLTAGEVVTLLEGHDEVARANFVVVSVGVNDTKDLHSDRRWTEELTTLLLSVCGQAQVVLLGVPPMETLPALPQPLARLLGDRARRLDRLGSEVAAGVDGVHHLSLRDLDLELAGAHALDGFHPSEQVHAELARRIDVLLA